MFDGAVYSGEEAVITTDRGGGEEYRVFRQGGTGFVSLQTVRDDAEQRMTEFCDRKGKVGQPLRERTSVPPHVLGNFPRVEIVFACVAKPASTTASAPGVDPKFTRLTNLKKLLDDRVITQQEFDAEKAKVLASP
ncbi:SHOCT domain-containing protein [Rhizobacter fulvus]